MGNKLVYFQKDFLMSVDIRKLLREVRCLASLVTTYASVSFKTCETDKVPGQQPDFCSLQTISAKGTFGTFESLPIEISSLDLGNHVNPPSCHIERQAICCLGHGNSSTYNFQTQSRSKLSETFCQVCLLPVELWKWIKFLYFSSYCVPLIELNLPLVPVVHFDSLEGESMQELKDYAVQKAEETMAATYKALNLMKRSLPSFFMSRVHQISHTHNTVIDIDHELS
ncbi:hypothetical protein SELMODRAFT_427828 [Selaginella moellendorffii]|uniref:Uncharacterized protein n=1 Tax=Selaginella moellendorffii TaxID=88036 RepID=D8T0U5_SELML|nr:hypothetical protein SELMODRAFT_427828 [Selaginella moellendorffii]